MKGMVGRVVAGVSLGGGGGTWWRWWDLVAEVGLVGGVRGMVGGRLLVEGGESEGGVELGLTRVLPMLFILQT